VQDLDDIRRLAAIDQYGLLLPASEPAFRKLTALAADLFDAPLAAISIVGMDVCWLRGRHGFAVGATARSGTLCGEALREAGNYCRADARQDAELERDVLVTAEPFVRFYASAPLRTPEGIRVGGIAIMSPEPREFSARETHRLLSLASTASALLMDFVGPAGSRDPSAEARFDDAEAIRKLRFAIDEIPAILWTTGLDLRFTSAWGAGLTALNLTETDVLGLSLEDFFARDLYGGLHIEGHRAALNGQGNTGIARFMDRTYRCRLDPIRNAAGAITGVIGLAVDITERSRSEMAVRDSETRYRLIARATNDVVRDWDIEHDQVSWTESLSPVFRYPVYPASTSMQWWAERIHSDDRERVLTASQLAIQSDASAWNEEYRFQRGDGSFASVFERGFITRDRSGHAVRMLGAMVDVTERKAMETKLIQAERLASMGTLATGVAHEINNPLTYIMANIGYVSERLSRAMTQEPPALEALTKELPELSAALTEAQDGAVRVRQIVRDLKVFARGDEERFGVMDVRRVLESSISMVWNEIRHRARLVKRLNPLPAVEGNESRLGQVFLNLLMNAAQAIRDGDASSNEILVATDTDAMGRACIRVEDTGVGISPDVLGRVFDPFFTTKAVGFGTGLGLFICHGIVKAMGGDIIAESEEGRGATFEVRLPAARVVTSPPEPVLAFSDNTPVLRRARVLVVDDEIRVANGLRRTLSQEYNLVLAYGGREAAALLVRDQNFDVILCDLMMPDLAGSDLFSLIEARWPQLAGRVIFMTGGAFTPETVAFLERIPNPRLDKPFDADRLRAIIRGLGT
jgi:PAS domain S-box-containing protein